MLKKPYNPKKIQGKYVYDYPKNREIGLQLKGAYSYITREYLKNKYTPQYVGQVFRGEKDNQEVVAAGKKYLRDLKKLG